MRTGLHYCRQTKCKGIEYLNYFELQVIMSMLLIAGRERNPGPISDSSVSSSDSITSAEEQASKDKLSVVPYNVQSILNKLDLIETELRHFDVICITESWLDQRTSDEDLNLNGYTLFRRDRVRATTTEVSVYMFVTVFILIGIMR